MMILQNLSFSHLLLFAFVLLLLLSRTPQGKGAFGEWMVNVWAKMFLDKERYHLVKDVTLPLEDGTTTQIDHIIVSEYGLFVVETKNYRGWIFGKEKDPLWTQSIYKKKTRFQNPLRQNYLHKQTLASLLQVPRSKIYSVIVFVGDSEFKTEMPDNVTHGRGFIEFIKSRREILFSEEQVSALLSKIEELRLARGLATNRQHMQNLKNRFGNSRPYAESGLLKRLIAYISKEREAAIVIACAIIGVVGFFSTIQNQKESSQSLRYRVSQDANSISRLDVSGSEIKRSNFQENASSTDYVFNSRDVEIAKRKLLNRNAQIENRNLAYYESKSAENRKDLLTVIGRNYEIELLSGKKIYSKSATIDGSHVTFITDTGLQVGLNMQDVVAIREIKKR